MNLLKDETSLYLLQHKDNPVHWMPWGEAAFAKAKKEDKPVLLSVGYSACHWCHVMAHESFEDPATADLMNRHFVNIKLDREERPDIDAIYQSALSLMGRQGGWPLTMFLTPAGEPFWGGTYFPPQPRHGLPAFREILRGVAESWVKDQGDIRHNVKSLAAALEKINTSRPGAILPRAALEKIGGYFLSLIDPAHGGIGSAPKFPSLPIMNFLWCTYLRTGGSAYKAAVIHSLTHMCQGGIYDHAGGGFARYAVDAEWLVPHFEKMLYDNAQFISLLTEVWKETQNPLFAARIAETVAWALREMRVDGGFVTALDADSEGVEGKYYVWTAAEVDAVLGPDAEAFKKAYDVTSFGNWEGVNILNRLGTPAYGAPEEEAWLASCLQKLKSTRDRRVPPGRDDKVLTDMNGLMISALAGAGAAFGNKGWLETAISSFGFVTKHMAAAGSRLLHAPKHAALLEDYANMAEAALALHEVTQEASYIAQAEGWIAVLDSDFSDPAGGGYFMSPSADTVVRPKSAQDGATPSGNGTVVGVLARLALLTGKTDYEERAQKTAEAFFGDVAGHFFPFATLLNNSDMVSNPLSLVIIGDASPFEGVLQKMSLPMLARLILPADASLPATHPAAGKTMAGGKPTAYVCFGRQCLAPAHTPEELESALRTARTGLPPPAANDG
jgi:uncharacterized protein YyaL (SSP411 family)